MEQVQDEFLSAKTLACRLGIGQSTLWRMTREGQLPAPDLRLGNRCTRWNWQKVKEFLERQNGRGA